MRQKDKEVRVLAVVSKPARIKMIAWPMMMRLMILRMLKMKMIDYLADDLVRGEGGQLSLCMPLPQINQPGK